MRFSIEKLFEKIAYIKRDEKYLFNKGFQPCCRLYNQLYSKSVYKGIVKSESLSNDYEILVFYSPFYPYRPPMIFPLNSSIINNRHQDPSYDNIPGKICLYNLSKTNDWNIGYTIDLVLERAIDWFKKFENGTLNEEIAPPEIDRYYPKELINKQWKFVIVEEFQKDDNSEHQGTVKIFDKYLYYFINHIETTCFKEYDNLLYKLTDASEENYDILWFDVEHEPFPFLKNTLELYQFLKKNSKSLNFTHEELAKRLGYAVVIAIRYYYGEEPQWLFFENNMRYSGLSNGKPKGFRTFSAAIQTFGKKEIKFCKEIEYLSYKAIFKRNKNQFNNFTDKKVLLLGLGTIGSKVAELLVKSGIKSLAIADKDKLEIGNICRHVLSISSIHKNKVDEMSKYLLKINPFLNIHPIQGDITKREVLDYKAFSEYDLVVSCIGDNNVETFIGKLSCKNRTETIFIRSHLLSSIGEIIYYKDSYPCFSCTKQFVESVDNKIVPKIPSIPFDEAFEYDFECGTPYLPAAAVDIEYISLLATQLIFQILNPDESVEDNYYLVLGRKTSDNSDYLDKISSVEPYSMNRYYLNTQVSKCDDCK